MGRGGREMYGDAAVLVDKVERTIEFETTDNAFYVQSVFSNN